MSTTKPAARRLSAPESAARAAVAYMIERYELHPSELTIHDPKVSDWYGDGRTWVVTGDLGIDWATFEGVHAAAAAAPGDTWTDAYDSSVMVIGLNT